MDKTEQKEIDRHQWQVPQCCREGWDSCPHVVSKDKKKKKINIGI